VATLPVIGYHDARPATPRRRPRMLPRLLLSLQVAARHEALDRELALGADPRGRPELALRAIQLERMRHRAALARTLRRVVADAAAPPAIGRVPPVAVQRRQVLADAADLAALADRLAFPQPPDSVTGVAIARRLITDGLASPLYAPCEPHTLRRLARNALAELGVAE
jgi:hypothetical protein